MLYEKIDLYAYFGLKRGETARGYLTAYVPERRVAGRVRPAALVIPGGAYETLSGREGEPVALRFIAEGYSAFVLDYALKTPYPVPLTEAAMAVAYLRENAARYEVDPAHIAAVGFSAGGHLAGMLATLFGEEPVRAALGTRDVRPDAVILAYPVLTTEEGYTHEPTARFISGGDPALRRALSLETRVTAQNVPAFLWHTADDEIAPVESSLRMAAAYREHGVPFSLHIFESGVHGLSVSDPETSDREGDAFDNPAVKSWLPLAFGWLRERGFRVR